MMDIYHRPGEVNGGGIQKQSIHDGVWEMCSFEFWHHDISSSSIHPLPVPSRRQLSNEEGGKRELLNTRVAYRFCQTWKA